MAFKYKIPRANHGRLPYGQISNNVPRETLSGAINGKKASDIEERFFRALSNDPRIGGVEFRVPVISARNLPGQLEVDFMFTAGAQTLAIQVDGEYAHKTTTQKQQDAQKDVLANNYLRKFGVMPIQRIDGDYLATQEEANSIVRDLL